MREIKFRAWDKAHGTMAIGSELGIDGLNFTETLNLYNDPYYHLMQYTGLKDKNGVEIYEGDIVDSKLFGVCEVVYFKNAFITQSIDGSYSRSSKYLAGENCEVIGNIYEHSHLLEQQ